MVNEVIADPLTVANQLRPVLLRLSRELRKETEQLGLTSRQATLLWLIRVNPGLSLRQLAAEERISAPALSGHVDRLEKAGLIERARDAEDRRRVGLTLTARARGCCDACAPAARPGSRSTCAGSPTTSSPRSRPRSRRARRRRARAGALEPGRAAGAPRRRSFAPSAVTSVRRGGDRRSRAHARSALPSPADRRARTGRGRDPFLGSELTQAEPGIDPDQPEERGLTARQAELLGLLRSSRLSRSRTGRNSFATVRGSAITSLIINVVISLSGVLLDETSNPSTICSAWSSWRKCPAPATISGLERSRNVSGDPLGDTRREVRMRVARRARAPAFPTAESASRTRRWGAVSGCSREIGTRPGEGEDAGLRLGHRPGCAVGLFDLVGHLLDAGDADELAGELFRRGRAGRSRGSAATRRGGERLAADPGVHDHEPRETPRLGCSTASRGSGRAGPVWTTTVRSRTRAPRRGLRWRSAEWRS